MKYIKQLALTSLSLFILLIPFNYTWSNIFLFLSVALTIIDQKRNNKFSFQVLRSEEKVFTTISIGYFLWCLISLIWCENNERGLQLAGRYILIAVFPLIFIIIKANGIIKKSKQLAYTFCLGCFVASFVCLTISFVNCWQETENGVVFSTTRLEFGWLADNPFLSLSRGYNNFSYKFLSHFMHPSYYSLMLLWGIIFLLSEWHNLKVLKYKVLILLVSIYFIIFTLILQSRGNILASITVLFLFIAYKMFEKKKLVISSILLCTCVFLTFTLLKNSRFSWIISNTIDAFKTTNKEERIDKLEHNVNDRIIIWQNAFQVIKEHPILGVGIGDTDTELENQYKKNGVDFTFGTHNQYIYAQLSMGIVGLLLLLAILLTPLYYGIKNRYFPLIGFSVAVMVNLMFENMLTRNAGLMFIPWATMLLLMMSEEKKKENYVAQ